jgi:hypothetical protein
MAKDGLAFLLADWVYLYTLSLNLLYGERKYFNEILSYWVLCYIFIGGDVGKNILFDVPYLPLVESWWP